ncbi:MAG: acyl-CoA dehydrogenase [Myxococcales bacterium]|nr:acyl-CoA dehydrogenase [Myxococcales bacterium]
MRDTARKWTREHAPVMQLRALRDARDTVGFSRAGWRELARLGLAGVTVPERWGGAGLGFAALGVVVEELGRTLATLPWLSSLMGTEALLGGASEAQRQAHLAAVCAGVRLMTLAHDEGHRHSRALPSTTATRSAGGFVLRGTKVMVLDGHVADAFVVSARDGEVTALFVVAAGARGLGIERSQVVDSRNAARLTLDGVTVREADRLGGAELLDRVLDRATIALSAEMLGSTVELFERTLLHLRTRRQFGVPIGSFQALQHRAAQLFCEIELLRSVVREALVAVDEGRSDVPRLACAAKARASDTFALCAAEAVQMHGGIGVTDELDVGLFFKRARVTAMLFGDAPYQRDRFARLEGY